MPATTARSTTSPGTVPAAPPTRCAGCTACCARLSRSTVRRRAASWPRPTNRLSCATARRCGSTSYCRRATAVPGAAVGAPLRQGQPAAARPAGCRVSVQYRMLRQTGPVRFSSLTGWEAPDPAWWAAHGYAVVNCDLRGAGTSDGVGSAAVGPGRRGRLRPDRMGRRAAVEHRRRRDARRVLPGHLAVEGRGAAAAEPQGDLPVGRVHRRVPGPGRPGGHPRGRLPQDVGPRAAAGPAALPHHRRAAPPPAARRLVARR